MFNNKYKKQPKGMILIFTLMMLLIMVLLGTAVVTSSKFTSNVAFNAATTSEALINADTTLRFSLRAARIYNTNLITIRNWYVGVEEEARFIGYCNKNVTKMFNIGYEQDFHFDYADFFHDIFYNRKVADIRYETALMLDVGEKATGQLAYIRELRLLYYNLSNSAFSFVECPQDYWGDGYVEDAYGNDLSEKGQIFPIVNEQHLGAGALNFNWQTATDTGGVSIVEGGASSSEDITGGTVIIAGVTASGGYNEAKAPARGSVAGPLNPLPPGGADSLPHVFALPTVLITSFHTIAN